MAIKKKKLGLGVVLAILFVVVLISMFLPLFGDGEEKYNAFNASDNLFNSISKGSTNKIEELSERAVEYNTKIESLELKIEEEAVLKNAEQVLKVYKFDVEAGSGVLKFNGDYGKLLEVVLKEAEDGFHNHGDEIEGRIGLEPRLGLYTWWHILHAVEKAFNDKGGKENFAAAKMSHDVNAKGVEVAYNYYGIAPESVGSKWWILTLALVFYVAYTLWWGYAIYFIAEGLGLQLTGRKKKEA